jgi:hypothetical protein
MHQPFRPSSAAIVLVLTWLAALSPAGGRTAPAPSTAYLQFVFTSDAHYGITRPAFRGARDVDAHIVNEALVDAINRLPGTRFPDDGGLRGGEAVGSIAFVAEGGDVANRETVSNGRPIQPSRRSWAEFRHDYLEGLRVTAADGHPAAVFVVPGNHDVSNAIGFYEAMTPQTDASSMAGIYDLMMRPHGPLTAATYDYARDRVWTTRDLAGLHFVFLTVWPDSQTRAWLENDLRHVAPATPVVLVTHDQPDAEAKHFRNPNGSHGINAADRFENLLSDRFADGATTAAQPVAEQRALEAFFRRHPNITAYFHGNSNWNQFYDWTGPDHTVAVHTFRVDSPMKGRMSRKDETKLSFQVATYDPRSRTLTVRECLWNTSPRDPAAPLAWGSSVTVALQPRPPGNRSAATRAISGTPRP